MSVPNVNVGQRLTEAAARNPDGIAAVEPRKRRRAGRRSYRHVTFRDLDQDTQRIAAGLHKMGVRPGHRLVLLVPPGIDFIASVFGLLKAGATIVLIDPGMGRQHLLGCLQEAEPDGFVAIPPAQAIRRMKRRRFPHSRFHVTAGRRWLWGGKTLKQLRQTTASWEPIRTAAGDPAAVIFTTGSTGPPKGVLYRHGNFDRQIDEIRDCYGIEPGEIDVAGFPLFALFNAVMGVTTVFPDMDFTRPAEADPQNIVEAIQDWKATQAFASPALWNVVGRYCEREDARLPTLRRVLSAGAPVPPHVLQRMKNAMAPEGEIHTPYGATEALPVATIRGTEVLDETFLASREGAGTCVGTRFPGIEWKVIRIRDEALETADDVEELPQGEVGELMVSGPVVTTEYVTCREANALHKVRDGERLWHRMGDIGYLDERGRFWFCGRKSHRVRTVHGTMYTDCCEAIFNQHPWVYRSALVGVGEPGHQLPVVVVETWAEHRINKPRDRDHLLAELWDLAKSNPKTNSISEILVHPSLPVDIRHNAKIFREQLAEWAATELRRMRQS